jgi:Tfp pilus assembly protein PilZ
LEIQKIQIPFKRKKAIEIKGRRRAKRFAFPYTVYFGPGRPPAHKSFVKDLSDKGVGIKTNMSFTPGTQLYLIIETVDKSYKAEGVVVWAEQITPGLVQLIKTGMGIKFTHVDHEFIHLYEEKFNDELVASGYVDIS